MEEHRIITLKDVVKKIPGLIKGTPQRLKGLGLVSLQNQDTPCGLIQCLEKSASHHPDNPAIFYEDQVYTYRDLMVRVNQVAAYLYESGTRQGDVVAVMLENRPELLIIIAALARLGAVGALLNTSQRGAVLEHSIKLVEPKRIVIGQELIAAIKPLSKILPKQKAGRLFVYDSTVNASEPMPRQWTDLNSAADTFGAETPSGAVTNVAAEPFCYFYTSGTTGLPKAAILTHGRFMKAYAGVGMASIQLKSEDRALVCLPFYHGTALAVGWGSVLAGDAALVMIRQFSASKFWQQVRDYEVTAICYVGELCRYLLANPASPQDRQHRVRLMFGNGLRPNIWTAFKTRFGIERVMEFYGSSEGNVGFLNLFNFDCTVGFTTVPYAIVEYDLENDEPLRFRDGFMSRVKTGQAGLLLGEITESSPFDGYTDPEKTEKTILRNVFRMGDAWFNTGDLMRDQGYRHAQFVDRLGDTFRWKGENVSTTEVENVLAGLDEVVDGAVYGVEIPGTNGRAGMACVRLQANNAFDAASTLKYLQSVLPKYAIPVFIRLAGQLETTGTHKYKKNELKKIGFDVSKTKDPIWVLLPGAGEYCLMDQKLYQAINSGDYSF